MRCWAHPRPLHPDDPAADIGGPTRLLLADTNWYLSARDDPRAAHILTTALNRRWKTTLGDDHPDYYGLLRRG